MDYIPIQIRAHDERMAEWLRAVDRLFYSVIACSAVLAILSLWHA